MIAVMLTLVPSTLLAQTDVSVTSADTGSSAEEDVVASPDDAPLERYAKFRRSWVVYREASSTQIYAITSDHMKREIQTLEFFTAFDANYLIKIVRPGRLEDLETGDPITSVEGLDPADFFKRPWRCRLVKTESDSAVYVVCGTKKRVIVREGVFHRYGWEFRDVEIVTEEELDALEDGDELNEETVFEEDVEIDSTEKRHLRERLQERMDLQGKDNIRERLVKTADSPDIYMVMPDGTRRHVQSMEALRLHRMYATDVSEVTDDEIEAFDEGEPIEEETEIDE